LRRPDDTQLPDVFSHLEKEFGRRRRFPSLFFFLTATFLAQRPVPVFGAGDNRAIPFPPSGQVFPNVTDSLVSIFTPLVLSRPDPLHYNLYSKVSWNVGLSIFMGLLPGTGEPLVRSVLFRLRYWFPSILEGRALPPPSSAYGPWGFIRCESLVLPRDDLCVFTPLSF